MTNTNYSYCWPHGPLQLDDLQTGTLLHLKNKKMMKKDGHTPFHFHLLLKSCGKKHLLLPMTGSRPMDSFWKTPKLSKDFFLPSPYDMGKPSFTSLSLMEWWDEDELMEMSSNGDLFYLTYLEEEELEEFGQGFMFDLYDNLPTSKYHLGWYLKFQKTWESNGWNHGWLPPGLHTK